MSKYKRIETNIKNPDLLRQALMEVCAREGLRFAEGYLLAHAYKSDQDTRVQFVIRKAELRSYGDLGFALTNDSTGDHMRVVSRWEGMVQHSTFEIIVDDLDRRGQKVASEVKRSYAILEATAQAQARGYTVSPVKDEQGRTLELRLRRY